MANESRRPPAFVTGAGGFVGRHLVEALLAEGREATVLLLPGEEEAFPYRDRPDVRIVLGDLLGILHGAIPEGSDVFHLAAQAHRVPRRPSDVDLFFRVNRDGTLRLADAAARAGARSFVFASTIAVYGQALLEGACDESTPPRPDTVYGRSKLEAEQGLPDCLGSVALAVLRPAVMYGPGDRGNVHRLIHSVRRGRMPLVGGGTARKSTLYVRNFARVAAFIADRAPALPARVLNVADPAPLTVRRMGEVIAEAVGTPLRTRNLPALLLAPPARVGNLIERVTGRQMPLNTRRLKVLLSDSLVRTDRLKERLEGKLSMRTFEEALREFLKPQKSSNRSARPRS